MLKSSQLVSKQPLSSKVALFSSCAVETPRLEEKQAKMKYQCKKSRNMSALFAAAFSPSSSPPVAHNAQSHGCSMTSSRPWQTAEAPATPESRLFPHLYHHKAAKGEGLPLSVSKYVIALHKCILDHLVIIPSSSQCLLPVSPARLPLASVLHPCWASC